jgi:hypothetical protein
MEPEVACARKGRLLPANEGMYSTYRKLEICKEKKRRNEKIEEGP